MSGKFLLKLSVVCSGTACSTTSNTNATAALLDNPSDSDIKNDRAWHSYTVDSTEPVKVKVSWPGNPIKLDLSSSSSTSACQSNTVSTLNRNDDQTVYLAGCNTGDGKVELFKASDDTLLESYSVTVLPAATLSPDPASYTFEDDEAWHRFRVTSTVEVKVVVNPSGSSRRVDISTLSSGSACPAPQSGSVNALSGNYVYIAGCSAGTTEIQLIRRSDNLLLNAYTVTIAEKPRGSLTPLPSGAAIYDNEDWHRFKVVANVPVKVVVNPPGSNLRLDISASSSSSACPASRSDSSSRLNNQYIYLAGCSIGATKVQVLDASDDSVLNTYTVDVKDEPYGSLAPVPNSYAKMYEDGKWHRFTVSANVPVEVLVNPPGSVLRVEIHDSVISSNHCSNGAERNDAKDRTTGQYIYLAGCSDGPGVVRVLDRATKKILANYTITVKAVATTPPAPPPATICKPVTGFTATRYNATSTRLNWTNPSGGLTPTQRKIEIKKWVNGAWQFERYITEPIANTRSLHLGLTSNLWYTYRIRSECSSSNSAWSPWRHVGPWIDGISGASGDETPSPTPGVPPPYVEDPEDEEPPRPREDE